MNKLPLAGFCCLLTGLVGCISPDGKPEFPWDSVSRREEPDRDPIKATVASTKAATRVHAIGATITSANSNEITNKPIFFTAGIQEPVLFSKKDGQIIISEGLVNRCASDDELAALLCAELGKIASQQQQESSRSELDLPPAPRLTSDIVGSGGAPDQTRLAEEAMMNRRSTSPSMGRRGTKAPKIDPMTLTRSYMKKAGYDSEVLPKVEPWLKEAEENADKREFMKGR